MRGAIVLKKFLTICNEYTYEDLYPEKDKIDPDVCCGFGAKWDVIVRQLELFEWISEVDRETCEDVLFMTYQDKRLDLMWRLVKCMMKKSVHALFECLDDYYLPDHTGFDDMLKSLLTYASPASFDELGNMLLRIIPNIVRLYGHIPIVVDDPLIQKRIDSIAQNRPHSRANRYLPAHLVSVVDRANNSPDLWFGASDTR
jgi:hypothetical protein